MARENRANLKGFAANLFLTSSFLAAIHDSRRFPGLFTELYDYQIFSDQYILFSVRRGGARIVSNVTLC